MNTMQVIAFLAYLAEARAERGPWLIAVPASLLANWEAELAAWAPHLNVVTYKGSPQAREALFASQAQPCFTVSACTNASHNVAHELLPLYRVTAMSCMSDRVTLLPPSSWLNKLNLCSHTWLRLE